MTQVIPLLVRSKKPAKSSHSQVPQLLITIPAEIRKQYNIKRHDTLLLVANQKEIKIYTKDEYMKRLAD